MPVRYIPMSARVRELHAAQEQAAHHQQDAGKRDLDHHQHISGAEADAADLDGGLLAFHGRALIDLGRAEGRKQSENHGGNQDSRNANTNMRGSMRVESERSKVAKSSVG